MRRELALAVVIAALRIGPAHADETLARTALGRALAEADSAACAAPRLAFTETVAEKGVVVAARFDPANAVSWTPVNAAPRTEQERKTFNGIVHDTPDERDLFLDRLKQSLGDSGRLLSEADGVAAFDFSLSPQAHPTHSPLDGAIGLSKHVRVTLSVGEADGQLKAIRFYAPAAFSATPLAAVSRLELRFALGPSYANGPIVVHRIDTDAAYRVVGVQAATRDTVWFSDVTPAPAAPKRPRC